MAGIAHSHIRAAAGQMVSVSVLEPGWLTPAFAENRLLYCSRSGMRDHSADAHFTLSTLGGIQVPSRMACSGQ
jgi:hypothetical protein